MKHAVQMGPDAVIYITSFIKRFFQALESRWGGYTHTDRQDGQCVSLLQERRLRTIILMLT
jgi:hypothetical protein